MCILCGDDSCKKDDNFFEVYNIFTDSIYKMSPAGCLSLAGLLLASLVANELNNDFVKGDHKDMPKIIDEVLLRLKEFVDAMDEGVRGTLLSIMGQALDAKKAGVPIKVITPEEFEGMMESVDHIKHPKGRRGKATTSLKVINGGKSTIDEKTLDDLIKLDPDGDC